MSGFLRIYVKKLLKSAQITQFFLLTDDRYINAEYHTEITYLNIISNFAYNSII
jgi:hypothetical protein